MSQSGSVFLRKLLEDVDKQVLSPSYSSSPGVFVPESYGASRWQQAAVVMNFLIAALGLAFSIISALYLSEIDSSCDGYKPEERKFLYATSILMCVLFGFLVLTGLYGLFKFL